MSSRELKVRRPFVIAALSIAFSITLILMYGIGAGIFAFICILAVAAFILVKFPVFSKHIFIILISMLIASSALTVIQTRSDSAFEAVGEDRYVEGTVCSYPVKRPSGSICFTLSDCSVENIAVPGRMYVYTNECDNIEPGVRTGFVAYSLEESADEGIFYYHTLSGGCYLTALAYDGFEILEDKNQPSFYTRILSFRKSVSDKFFRYLGHEEAAVVNALVTGDKAFLSDKVYSGVRMSGISHIFAVSGMHLAIWTSLFFLIFRQRSYSAFIPNFLAIIFVLFYCAFTGFSPSVLRSGIMLVTVFLGRILRKSSDSLNSLGFAATALLLYNPFLIGNVSFLLSFIATLCVVTTTDKVSELPPFAVKKTLTIRIKELFYKLTNPLMLSFCVMLMTMPVVSVFFGYFSVLSPLSSLVMTPVAEALMITGGLAQLIPGDFFLSEYIFSLVEFLSGIMIKYVCFAGSLSFSITSLSFGVLIICMLIAAVLYFLIPVIPGKKRSFSLYVLMNVIVVMIYSVFAYLPISGKTMLYIPANATDTCISVYSFGEFSAVYGTGSKYSDASAISAYLTGKGSPTADYLFDPDFTVYERGNILHLLAELSPRYVFRNTSDNKLKEEYSFISHLSENTEIYSVSDKNFCAAVITADDIKIVICSDCNSDFSDKDEIFKSGDILICEKCIPSSLDRNNFRDVIILTDEKAFVGDGILTNKDKAVEITIEGDSYAVN